MMSSWESVIAEHRRVLDAAAQALAGPLERALEICLDALNAGHRMLVCGNGGSAADAQHFAAELVGSRKGEGAGLPVIALTTDTSVLTAVANDHGFEWVFARQLEALGRSGDVLIAISTSGVSPNVLAAVEAARERRMHVVALTGEGGGRLAGRVDVLLAVPSRHTARVQELHLLCLHALAEGIESGVAGRARGETR